MLDAFHCEIWNMRLSSLVQLERDVFCEKVMGDSLRQVAPAAFVF